MQVIFGLLTVFTTTTSYSTVCFTESAMRDESVSDPARLNFSPTQCVWQRDSPGGFCREDSKEDAVIFTGKQTRCWLLRTPYHQWIVLGFFHETQEVILTIHTTQLL